MEIQSSAFKNGETIPDKYTCSGQNISPPLQFRNVSKEAQSLVLIVDDPDAPNGTFDHWVAWNIPGNTVDLPEAATLPHLGKNGYGDLKYRGPCPPPGKPHRYFFKLYALNTKLNIKQGATKQQIESAMENHIIAKAELIGLFGR